MPIKITDIRNLNIKFTMRRASELAKPVISFEAGEDRYHIWVERRSEDGPWRTVGPLYKRPLVVGPHDNGNVRQLEPTNASNAPIIAWIVQQPQIDLNSLDARIADHRAELEAAEKAAEQERLDKEAIKIRAVVKQFSTKLGKLGLDLERVIFDMSDTEALAFRTALMNMEA